MFKRNLIALLAALPLWAAADQPFTQFSQDTTNLAVTASAQNLTLPAAALQATRQIVLTTVGTQVVFVRCDGATSTASNAMPLLPNSQILVTVGSGATTCSAIAAATGSTVYATAGSGV